MVQTRRFARRVDENALPATSTIATRSRSANTANAASNNGSNTAIPVMKKTGSTAGATTRSSTLTADTKSTLGKTTMTRRRAALGEIPQASENGPKKSAAAGKGKAVERRPLQNTQQTQQPLRRTTRRIVEPKEEKVPISKRKLPSTNRPTRPPNSRANSITSTSTTTSDRGARVSRNIQPHSSLPEAGPAAKRLRPSPSPSPPPEEEEVADVLQVADYDADVPELKVERIQRSPRPVAKDLGWTDLDAEDEGDPTMVSEYVIDAFNYMMELEVSNYSTFVVNIANPRTEDYHGGPRLHGQAGRTAVEDALHPQRLDHRGALQVSPSPRDAPDRDQPH